MSLPNLHQHYYLIDTRSIWNSTNPSHVQNPPNTIASTASAALAIVPQDEREKAQRFHFHRDAKLSLASSLLKRYFISTVFPNAFFSHLELSRRGSLKHGKPSYTTSSNAPKEEKAKEVDFNVSHQAGLVALAGYAQPRRTCSFPGASSGNSSEPSMTLGVDITNTHERHAQDHRLIAKSGFDGWVDMHEDIFSPADLTEMKQKEVDDFGYTEDDEASLDRRRRRFYTYWCLKEAYVKLEGEALLAGWLREVEFRKVRVPEAGRKGQWGETIGDIEVWRKGVREEATRMEVRAWNEEFIVGLAVKGDASGVLTGNWQLLDIEKVVEDQARTSR